MFSIPILLITFNRPDHVRQVLTEIRKQKPAQLFVCQDGAREGNQLDVERVQQVRDVITELIDWPCELHTLFQEKNLGCGLGPAEGITWFFEHVEMGIILEDDCVPSPDFYPYCETLLEHYKNDERISIISGCYHGENEKWKNGDTYYFSHGNHATWGWASWRRVWKKFDYYLKDIDMTSFKKILSYYVSELREFEFWCEQFEMTKSNRINESAWDFQFWFACWRDKMLSIKPNYNLISNIGTGPDATHTFGDNSLMHRDVEPFGLWQHPAEIVQNKRADHYLHSHLEAPYEYGWSGLLRLPYRINKRIKRLIGHKGPWLNKK